MQDVQVDNIGNIIEPEPIGFTLEAPGWYLLAGVALVMILVYAYFAWRKYQNNKYRREALSTFEMLQSANLEAGPLIFGLLEVLKRVTLTSYGRTGVAPLNGNAWIHFLEEKNKGEPVFSESSRVIISTSLYQGRNIKVDDPQLQRFLEECTKWIRTHRV